MTIKELAYHVMQMRDLQIQYFASGKPRFRDKALLAKSKDKEAEVDKMVERVIMQEKASEVWNLGVLDGAKNGLQIINIEKVDPPKEQKEDVPSYFEKNAIFGDGDFDSNPY